MFVIQCIIISVLCAVSGNAFPLLGNLKRPLSGNSLGWYTLGRPLIGGTICGIILGDIKAGVELGIGVQLVYLAVVTPGGAVGLDVSFMAYPVIAIGILGKLDAGATIAIASGIGVLGSFTFTAQAAVGSMIKGIYTKSLTDHDYKGFVKNSGYIIKQYISHCALSRLLSQFILGHNILEILWRCYLSLY